MRIISLWDWLKRESSSTFGIQAQQMDNLIIVGDLNYILYALNRAPTSCGVPFSIKMFCKNNSLCKRPEQTPYMKECSKIALKWTSTMCVLCARTNSTISFLSCSWTLDVKALWDLIMRLKYFTYEISSYNTHGHKRAWCWSSTERAVYPNTS